jgi:mannose-6-phosphate isomerase-like protein (cupin superfamily)
MTETLRRAPDVAVIRDGRPLDVVALGGTATAIVWPGMGSRHRSMHRIELESGGQTLPLRHDGEAVYFVAEGRGVVEGTGASHELRAHAMLYVPHAASYRLRAEEPMAIWGGPCPPDPALYEGRPPRASTTPDAGTPLRVFDADVEGVPLPMIGKHVRLVVWPGEGAEIATMNFAELEPGEENQPHAHEASDDTIAILGGRGSIDDLTNEATYHFETGDVVFVRAGIRHKVKADKGVPILSAGGPCPPDFGMLTALGLL